MDYFINEFMQCNGIPIQHTSKECMDYLQNTLGYSLNVARGIMGRAVARGFIVVSAYEPVKSYN